MDLLALRSYRHRAYLEALPSPGRLRLKVYGMPRAARRACLERIVDCVGRVSLRVVELDESEEDRGIGVARTSSLRRGHGQGVREYAEPASDDWNSKSYR